MAGSLPPTPLLPPVRSAADRLDSWKEIAAHLKRDVRTVQRWEKEHALPVRRHVNARQGSVFAYKEEVDGWWNARRSELEAQGVPRRTLLRRLARSRVTLGVAAGVTIAAAALAIVKRTVVTAVPMVGLSVLLGPDLFLDTTSGGRKLAWSPDGSQLVFVGRRDGRIRLFLRRLDRFESTVLPGTDNAISPFFSPDGRWVGFVTIDGIKRVAIDGGTPELVCRAPEAEGGGVWHQDGTIIFGGGQPVGLMRASVRDGTCRALTQVDTQHGEMMHSDPNVLPGGRTVLYTVTLSDKTGMRFRIDAVSLESAERRTILADGSLVGYVAGAGLIFYRGTRVMAARFDPERLAVTSDPVAVLDDANEIAVTHDGIVAYIPGPETSHERTFVWVDLQGREQPVNAPPRAYLGPKLSPDGRRIAVGIFDGERSSTWIFDLVRSALMPLTSDSWAARPTWTPDGRRIVLSSIQNGRFVLLSQPSDRSGPAELLTADCGGPTSFSRDGQRLFCAGTSSDPASSGDIWVVSDAGHGVAKPFLQAPFIQKTPKASPDDRWLAYVSDESGRWEVYVTALPGPRGKWQISADGGEQPVWSRDGRTLFFRGSGNVMSVAIEPSTSSELVAHPPTAVFEDVYVLGVPTSYDVSTDGSRLLMIKGERSDQVSEIRVLQGWKTKVASLVQQSR